MITWRNAPFPPGLADVQPATLEPPTAHHADAADRVRAAYHAALLEARPSTLQLSWRLGRFDRGMKLLGEIEQRVGSLAGKRLLDLGAAHGGDACAAISKGMAVTLTDLTDHGYDTLCRHVAPLGAIRTLLFDLTQSWPLDGAAFDLVLGMAIIDHVADLGGFFKRLARMLVPGGISVIDTPTALRSVHRDGHYGLPGVSLLPTRARRFVAERLIGRRYRCTLADRTYYSAGPILRAAAAAGLQGLPHKYADSPLMARLGRWPAARAWRAAARHVCFDYVLLRKP